MQGKGFPEDKQPYHEIKRRADKLGKAQRGKGKEFCAVGEEVQGKRR